jgi:hypothetical protein
MVNKKLEDVLQKRGCNNEKMEDGKGKEYIHEVK